MLFRGEGGRRFKDVLERAMREPEAVKRWYLSSVNELAQTTSVATLSITGLWWGELDSAEDLAFLRASLNDDEKDPDKDDVRVHRAQFSPV